MGIFDKLFGKKEKDQGEEKPKLGEERVKVRIRNVDFEPFVKEIDLPETDDLYPHLRIRHYRDTVLAIALKPGPFVELVLSEKNLALKRGTGLALPDEMETVVSTAESPEPAKVEGKRGKKAGMQFRVRTKDVEPYVFGAALTVGRFERGVFQGTHLDLYRYADGIVTFSTKPGPMLEIFLMNGTMWRVDVKDEEQIVMSTEEADFRVREGEQLSDSAQRKKQVHFG